VEPKPPRVVVDVEDDEPDQERDEVEGLGRLVLLLDDPVPLDGENAVETEFDGRFERVRQRSSLDDPEFQLQLPHEERRRRHPSSCATRAFGASPPISGPMRWAVCCCCCGFGARQSALRAGIM
jgi:hypothetical protein